MKIFETLAQDVETAWSKSAHSLESFPEIATKALQDFKYSLSKDDFDKSLSEWLLQTQPLPEQINVHNTFGQPPVTVFNNGRFVVDIYIWLNFDTSIHSHGFRGAFKVLHGKSLQEDFKPKTLKTYAPDTEQTELGTPEMSLLFPGDVRTIAPGKDLTHRVIHLENPTVTLCVKTINEPSLRQWNYFPNGLAIQKRSISGGLVKSLYYFQYLMGQNPTICVKFLGELLDQTDLSMQMNLCEEISSGAYGLTEGAAEFVLDQVSKRHADTEWFQRYEQLMELGDAELHFEHTDVAAERLLAHFVNCQYSAAAVLPLLSKLTSTEFSQDDMEDLLGTLVEDPRLFGGEGPNEAQALKIRDFK